MSDRSPRGNPPILLDTDYSALPAGQLGPGAAVEGGQLVLRGNGANTIAGHAFSDVRYRDVIVDVSLAVASGDDGDLAGVFLRQSADQRYIVVAISAAGYVYIAQVDGAAQPVAEGPLTPNIPFHRGLGAWNRLTIVAFGPSLVFVLNGEVLAHLAVDQRFKEGFAGLFLQQGGSSPAASAAARWVQIRAVLPDQE
jgi:hypothetical protein